MKSLGLVLLGFLSLTLALPVHYENNVLLIIFLEIDDTVVPRNTREASTRNLDAVANPGIVLIDSSPGKYRALNGAYQHGVSSIGGGFSNGYSGGHGGFGGGQGCSNCAGNGHRPNQGHGHHHGHGHHAGYPGVNGLQGEYDAGLGEVQGGRFAGSYGGGFGGSKSGNRYPAGPSFGNGFGGGSASGSASGIGSFSESSATANTQHFNQGGLSGSSSSAIAHSVSQSGDGFGGRLGASSSNAVAIASG